MLDAIILGLLQGLTEFLPISSSGHLVLGQQLLGVLDPAKKDVLFEVVLHLGTLVAILAAYRRDVLRLLRALPSALLPRKPVAGDGREEDPAVLAAEDDQDQRRLLLGILMASLPAALIGFTFKDFFEEAFVHHQLVSGLLICTGLILLAGDRLRRGERRAEHAGPLRSLLVGLAQALAILPGISRSGSTIVTGMALGIKPEEAARFSFLISIPAILGAAVLEVWELLAEGALALDYSPAELFAGFISSAAVGYLALQWLLVAVRRRNLTWFALYCFLLGGGTLFWNVG